MLGYIKKRPGNVVTFPVFHYFGNSSNRFFSNSKIYCLMKISTPSRTLQKDNYGIFDVVSHVGSGKIKLKYGQHSVLFHLESSL